MPPLRLISHEYSRGRRRLIRLASHRCKPLPVVGDCQNVSQGLALAMLPHAAALAIPSARVRRQASPGTRQGQSLALRQSRCWAYWPLSLCSSPRCGSTRHQSRGQAPTDRDRSELLAAVRPHLRSASRWWAGWHPIQCQKPRMQATARARRPPARLHQGVGVAALAPNLRAWSEKPVLSCPMDCDWRFVSPSSDGKGNPYSQDSFVHEPPALGSMRCLGCSNSIGLHTKIVEICCLHWEH